MIWFLERDSELLICEIRRAQESEEYEFEVVSADGPAETQLYSSPSALIDSYLRTQSVLQSQGWRPRMNDIDALA